MSKQPQDAEVVAKLAEFHPGDGRHKLDLLIGALRERMAAEPEFYWHKVEPIFESQNIPLAVQEKIFSVVRETADATTVKAIIAAAAKWSDLGDKKVGFPAQWSSDSNPAPWLCNDLLSTMIANTDWLSWAVEEPMLKTFLVNVAIGGTGSLHPQDMADLLSNIPLDFDVKSAISEEIIFLKTNGAVDRNLYYFLNPDAIHRLRQELKKPVSDPIHFHYGAAGALTDLGDLASIPILEGHARSMKTNSLRFAKDIQWRIDRIKVQHPPSQLLQWIADPARATAPTYPEALWAMNRAVELGVDRNQIRLAVLQLAENIRQHEAMAPVILYQIKSVASKLSLLHPDDLKDVVRPPLLDQLSRD